MPLQQIVDKYKKFISNLEFNIKEGAVMGDRAEKCRNDIACYREIVSDLEKELPSSTLSDGEIERMAHNDYSHGYLAELGSRERSIYEHKKLSFIAGYKSKPSINLPTMDECKEWILRSGSFNDGKWRLTPNQLQQLITFCQTGKTK